MLRGLFCLFFVSSLLFAANLKTTVLPYDIITSPIEKVELEMVGLDAKIRIFGEKNTCDLIFFRDLDSAFTAYDTLLGFVDDYEKGLITCKGHFYKANHVVVCNVLHQRFCPSRVGQIELKEILDENLF